MGRNKSLLSRLGLVNITALHKEEGLYMVRKAFSENDELMAIPCWESIYGTKYIFCIVSGFSSRFGVFVRIIIPVGIGDPFYYGLNSEPTKHVDELVEELKKMGYKVELGSICEEKLMWTGC